MRITFISALWLPATGGLEIVTDQMLRELRDRGHEVSIVTTSHDRTLPSRERIDGIDVVRTDAHSAIADRDLPAILRLQRQTWEVVGELQPEVLHAHDGSPALWMYLRAARTSRPPLVLTLHSVMSRQFQITGASLGGLRTMLRAADRVTGVSDAVIADATELEPSIATRVSIVPNGVRRPTRTSTPVADVGDELLCIGRLAPQKDFARALRILRRLRERHPHVRLTIAGDGEERASLIRLARELGIDDRVEFLGLVDHARIPELLDLATVVVMPSQFEGMPLVALEAAWMARPVVATAVPGLSGVVVNGVTGFLVDDDDAMAHAIGTLLADRTRARSMGKAARMHAESEFSLDGCVDRYETIYSDLVSVPPGGTDR